MTTTRTDVWVERCDRAAGELLDQPVLAAAQFLRARGWRAFGQAVAGRPAGLLARARGRRRPTLPQACVVAVTEDEVHLLAARPQVGAGPMPRPTGRLMAFKRRAIAVAATPELTGTRLRITPRGGAAVELHGPPGELTARVVRALVSAST